MNLVVFDIDGTLTDTNKVDLDCYFRALEDELLVPRSTKTVVDDDLVTDTGFARASYQNVHGTELGDAEIEKLKSRFMLYIRHSYDSDPAVVREINGAARLLKLLSEDPHWCIALATGCWLQSATFKLEKARLFDRSLPIATCDDSPRRSEIVTHAVRRSLAHYKLRSFERIVAVGDRPWDLHVARKLNYAFIGVDSDSVLASLGATATVTDYRDPEGFVGLLQLAGVPRN